MMTVELTIPFSISLRIAATLGPLLICPPCSGQDIEPRRWGHLPIGASFAGVAYGHSSGDISLNPVLHIEDGEFDLNTAAAKYIRSFEVFGKSARFDLTQAYQSGTWSGLIDGTPASVDRDGWADTTLRLAVNLYGAPPLAGREFAEFRATTHCETIVGMGLVVQLPTGEYHDDKLINLGTNRFSFTPQIGVVHTRGKWSGELSGSCSLFSDNEDYFNGQLHKENGYLVGQGHLIYSFLPGLWLGASIGYGYGGESIINKVPTGDRKGNFGWGLSMGIPINRAMGFKLAYIATRSDREIGTDTDTFSVAFSILW